MSYEKWEMQKSKVDDEEYSVVAEWCNKNGYMIVDSGKYFKTAPVEVSEEDSFYQEKQELVMFLKDTDYVVIKIAEGEATAEDYADILQKRKQARARISEIDGGK